MNEVFRKSDTAYQTEVILARVEPVSRRSNNVLPFRRPKAQWQLSVEASCWLYPTIQSPTTNLKFCLSYTDALKRHSVVIDRAPLSYLRESLLSGRFNLKGIGELKDACLLVVSDVPSTTIEIEVRSLHFNVVRSSETLNPRYRLVSTN